MGVIGGNQAAEWNPRLGIEQRHHGVEYLATDIFIINVDALGTGLRQFLSKIRAPVIDAGVETQLVDHIAALFRTTRHTNHPQALDLRHLPDHRPHRPGRRRDHQGFAGLGLADVHQAHVRSHARHTQYPESHRRAWQRGNRNDAATVIDAVALPTGGTDHQITFLKLRIERTLDPADSAPGHDFADFHRRGVGRCVTHASAHVGIQRQENGLEQHLTVGELRQRHPLHAEVFRCWRADRA
ncbi:hypothetical protein D3C78_580580 [compost metagenome]